MKKLTALHILNGDASLAAFESAAIPGQVLVWREILSEGPAIYTLPDQEFWDSRRDYITATYEVSAADYKIKVLDELPKLQSAATFFEVVLWFDADLMCQINLLYLLHMLYLKQPGIVSICTPPAKDSIATMNPDRLAQLFEKRERVSEQQLAQAHQLWKLYASPDPLQLQHYLHSQDILLPILKQALLLHLQRFPNCTTSLSLPHELMLEIVGQGCKSTEQLMQRFWQLHPEFGFGDWQLQTLLAQLQPSLILEQQPLKLTAQGVEVYAQKSKYSDWLKESSWLGGVQLKPKCVWCYHQEKKHLVKLQ